MSTVANRDTTIPRRLLDKYLREASEAVARRNEELGRRIRAARDLKRWKQKELARAVHVEPVTVSRWERGENTPDLGKLELIAEALDQPLAYFVEQPAEATPQQSELLALREETQATRAVVESLLLEVQELRRSLLPNKQASG